MIIISKDNKDHEAANKKHKKYYIVFKQSERMYLCEAGFFIPLKEHALGINSPDVAAVALIKVNEYRKMMNQKPLCELIYE